MYKPSNPHPPSLPALSLHTSGPKIRTGSFKGGPVTIEKGQSVTLTTDESLRLEGTASKFYVDYKDLYSTAKEVKDMNRIQML